VRRDAILSLVDSGVTFAAREHCERLLTERPPLCTEPRRDGEDVLPPPPPTCTRRDPFTRRYFARTRGELERRDRARSGRLLSL
jgi:hypothetical protein